jgi:RHS repeat-associated protein
VTDQDGHVTRLGYDAAGALARREHDDGTWVAFTYDPALGLMTGASNAGSRAEFAYDDAGQLLSEAVTTAAGAYRVESRYDVMGNRVERRTSTGHVARYTHSPNGNLRALAADGRPAVTFRYNAAGEEVARAFPGGGDLTHEYDARGRVTRQRVRRRGGAPDVLSGRASVGGGGIDRRYRYDPHGSLTLLQDAFWGPAAFDYDPGERLLRAAPSAGPAESYAYDGTGNVIAGGRADAGPPDPWAYDARGRLAAAEGWRYEYDGAGRVVARAPQSGATAAHPARGARLTWDGENRLVAVTTERGERWRYEYDALGRRLAKHLEREASGDPFTWDDPHDRVESPGRAGLGSTYFAWDGDQVVEERRGGGQRLWVFEPDTFDLVALFEGRGALFAVTGPAGAPRELVHADGRCAWAARHSAWGVVEDVVAEPGVDCPLRFEGQWFDEETGLHYNRHRYYDPQVGRYLSPDPLGIRGDENPYAYSVNPVGWVDPFGLVTCPKKKRSKKAVVSKGSDAPKGAGIYEFTDKNGNRYVGSTNDFQGRMRGHLDSGHLPPGTTVKFTPIDDGGRSAAGGRRVRRFFEQASIGTDANGNVKKNPSSNWAAVQQDKWDAYGKGTDFSNAYFD